MKKLIVVVLCLFMAGISNAQCKPECDNDTNQPSCCAEAACCPGTKPHEIAPIGVMGDHYHHRGGLMASYRYMDMRMEGNIRGSNPVSDTEILNDYMMVPDAMSMQMHMVGMMYGITDRITFMAMVNYLDNDMDMLTMNGTRSNHSSSGYGDVKLSLIAGLWENGNQSFLINTGLSIPTGDIDQDEMHHHGNHEMKMNLPYPMQLGSGTTDLLLGAAYLSQWDKFSFGLQPNSVIRTGKNHNGYTLGNQYQLNSWLGYQLNDWLSVSLRLKGAVIEKIEGSDSEMMADMSPTSDALNSGSKSVRAFTGLNILIPGSAFDGLNIGFEYGQPIYQDVNGIQMDQGRMLTAGLRYSLF